MRLTFPHPPKAVASPRALHKSGGAYGVRAARPPLFEIASRCDVATRPRPHQSTPCAEGLSRQALGSHLRFSLSAKLLSRRFLLPLIFGIREKRVLFAVTSGAPLLSKVWPPRGTRLHPRSPRWQRSQALHPPEAVASSRAPTVDTAGVPLGAVRCDVLALRRGDVAVGHGRCARAHRRCCSATQAVCTCAQAMLHCNTGGVHVRTGRVALQHGRCARAHRRCCTATQAMYACAQGVLQCNTGGVRVRTGGVAVRHGRCARARRGCCSATQAVCTCAQGVLRQDVGVTPSFFARG